MIRIILHNLLNSYFYFIIALVLFVNTVQAQYDPQFTQYQHNTTAVNPAFAGSLGQPIITAIERAQWAGLKGAPHTQSLGFHMPSKINNLGFGLNIINDAIGPLSEVYLDAISSYAVILPNETRLAFGLKLGGRYFQVDKNKINLENSNDAKIQDNINKLFMTVGAGLYFNSERFYAGVSVPNLIPKRTYSGGELTGSVIDTSYQIFTIAGYAFDIDENTRFKPAILLRVIEGSPISLDTSANFLLHERVHLGLSYRLKDALSFSAGFGVNKNLFVGYSYDMTTSKLRVVNLGSHELVLKYKLGNQKERRFKCESGGLAWY